MKDELRELRYFPNGYERYKSVADFVERECSKLTPTKVIGDHSTYEWNGMTVEIYNDTLFASKSVIIRSQDPWKKLSVTSGVYQSFCSFNIEGKPFFMGSYYYPNISESYLSTGYQSIVSTDSAVPPDKITTIISEEIERANFEDLNENGVDLNSAYRERLKAGLEFFNELEELTKYEEKQEENPEPEKMSKKDRLRAFCQKEGIGPAVISAYLAESLAQQARTGDVMSAEATLERDLGNPEIEKRGPSIG